MCNEAAPHEFTPYQRRAKGRGGVRKRKAARLHCSGYIEIS